MSYTLLKVGRVWHYRYQIKRRRIQRSTRESNKRLADAIAHKAYSVAQQEQRGESTIPTLLELIKKPFQKTVGLLIVATIPAVVIALISKKIAPIAAFFEAADAGQYLGFGFLLTSLLLFISDRVRHTEIDENGEKVEKKGKKLKNMQVTDALIIGCMQGVGVLPGVSRSGSTISGALFAGLNRKTAADFSFLMSIPAIIGGAVFEIPDALKNGIGDMHWTAVVAGMLVAGITGYFAIKVMIDAIKKKKLTGFVIYTGILGALVLVDQYVTHYFF